MGALIVQHFLKTDGQRRLSVTVTLSLSPKRILHLKQRIMSVQSKVLVVGFGIFDAEFDTFIDASDQIEENGSSLPFDAELPEDPLRNDADPLDPFGLMLSAEEIFFTRPTVDEVDEEQISAIAAFWRNYGVSSWAADSLTTESEPRTRASSL